MPRPFKQRNISGTPDVVVYKPAGIPARTLDWVTLTLDEYHAIKRIDHEGADQETVADEMGVSRPTVTRIYGSARKKIADVIVKGKALRIEGGPVTELPAHKCRGMGRVMDRGCGRAMGRGRQNDF